MKVKNLALALALASVACGGEPEFESELSRESEEVINGVPATDAQSGLQGALFVRPGLFRRFQCGATYLGENSEGEHWVLTAAHCVDDVSGPMWVGFGRSNRNSYRAADLISVDQIKIHGNYDLATIVNDIAVVRLVERPTRAQVVDLAEESAPRFTGAVAEIVGFGRGTNGPLLRGVTRVIGTQECREWYSIVTANNICVRDNVGTAQSACSGDSGGPLYIRGTGEQAGIASFAEADCSIDAPQGYTRVSSFRRWIRQATGGL